MQLGAKATSGMQSVSSDAAATPSVGSADSSLDEGAKPRGAGCFVS